MTKMMHEKEVNNMKKTEWVEISAKECRIKCLLCGHESYTFNHFSLDLLSEANTIKILKRRAVFAMKKHLDTKHKLRNVAEIVKPWKDPESLFCDTEFLEKPIEDGGLGIDVRKGKECKDEL